MPEANERVLAMVRDEIQKDADVKTVDLFEKAKKLSKDIGSLNIRQFHARYPLQVKRVNASTKRRRAGKRAATAKKNAQPRRGRPPGRKPGRPPRSAKAQAAVGAVVRRGPGRPRKDASAASAGAASSSAAPAVKRGPGRPPRSASSAPAAAAVKRRPGRPPRSASAAAAPASSTGTANRGAVRAVLLQFAKDIAGAEQRSKFVDVIGGIDGYVEKVLRAAGVR